MPKGIIPIIHLCPRAITGWPSGFRTRGPQARGREIHEVNQLSHEGIMWIIVVIPEGIGGLRGSCVLNNFTNGKSLFIDFFILITFRFFLIILIITASMNPIWGIGSFMRDSKEGAYGTTLHRWAFVWGNLSLQPFPPWRSRFPKLFYLLH